MNTLQAKTLRDLRPLADLKDERSFDMAGRDGGETALVSGSVLADLARNDERIVLGTADLQFATQMVQFRYEFPERLLQFGISERNMLGAAAGLASAGYIPYVCTFACFAGVLGFENIKTDMAYPKMPVRVLATHAGISMGFFATSHHATEDIGALRTVANLMVLSPSDGPTFEAMLRATVDHPGPIYFRLGRGREPRIYGGDLPAPTPGAPTLVRDAGKKVLIVATGAMLHPAIKAAEALGEGVSVFDAHTLKPFDPSTIVAAIGEDTKVLVVEEHNVEGGVGSIVREALYDAGVYVPVYKHGLLDEFAIVGPPAHLYEYYGLDAAGIATIAQRLDAASGLPKPGSLWTEDDRAAVSREVAANRKVRVAISGTGRAGA
ncbi:transketolase family protein [Shinella sp.]|uniref:transketolase family protein n=1 Tax=Shinella sp. TaxID=1870904 RepID=UPI0029B02A74|nr:transketolase C-terminal domain-containing protein [Shinella sp.]MDX3978604.1 transketolase C-terminal domain-containing protein [Shinella sp.]